MSQTKSKTNKLEKSIQLCPKCNSILYPINSLSDKRECLQKCCSYSEVSKIGIDYDIFN